MSLRSNTFISLPKTSLWIVKHESHKPFLSFVFQELRRIERERGKKKCCFTDWIRFEPKFMLFLELTTSSPLVSCLFIRNGRFLIGPSVPVTAHFFNFEVEIMCWAALWSTCFLSDLPLWLVLFLKQNSTDTNRTFPSLFISLIFVHCVQKSHVSHGQMWLDVRHKRTCLSIFKGKGDAFFLCVFEL